MSSPVPGLLTCGFEHEWYTAFTGDQMPQKTRLFFILIPFLVVISACNVDLQQLITPFTPSPASQLDPSSIIWTKSYGGSSENMSTDIALAPDGGFLLVGGIGKIFDEKQEGGVLLMKTDADGNFLWQKVFGGEEFDIGWSITQTKDGHFLIAGETTSFGSGGRDIYLIKVDEFGDELWSKTYGSELDETVAMVQPTFDGGYLLICNKVNPRDIITDPGKAGYGGFAGRSNILIIKIDSDGNEIWSQILTSDANTIASSGLATQDGGYLILATIIDFPSLDNDINLIKLDGKGNRIWTRSWKTESYAGYDLLETSADSYLITGIVETDENPASDVFLLNIDNEGRVIWQTNFDDPEHFQAGKRVLQTQAGEYLILCSETDDLFSGVSRILLVAADGDGNPLWEKSIRIFHSSKVSAILEHPEGGFVIAGASIGSSQTFNTFLIKTDPNGKMTADVEMILFP